MEGYNTTLEILASTAQVVALKNDAVFDLALPVPGEADAEDIEEATAALDPVDHAGEPGRPKGLPGFMHRPLCSC